ncbi:MAG: RNA polymerase sigma factor [Rhodothermales bacterium]
MADIQKYWQQAIQHDDEDAFQKAVEPMLPTLTRVARRELAFYLKQRYIHPRDFSAEEVVGETLLQAWRHRSKKPKEMSIRGWLLGTQHRALRNLVQKQREYREDKAISLDAPLPTNPDSHDTQEAFWDWYQSDEDLTWEDVIPATSREEVEISLDPDRDHLFASEDEAHVLMMHDEFRMPLPEVAFTMNRSLREIGDLLANARTTLHQHGSGTPPITEVDEPTPPRGTDDE